MNRPLFLSVHPLTKSFEVRYNDDNDQVGLQKKKVNEMGEYVMQWDSLQLSEGALDAFSYVLRNNPATKADICRCMGKGISTVNRYMTELCEKGLVLESGVADSSGGRKPVLYSINSQSYLICCVNISTIYCEVAVADMALHVLKIDSISIGAKDTPDEIIARIGQAYRNQLAFLGADENRFLGMGVSVFGAIKNEQGVLYKPIIQYMNEQWDGYPILQRLQEEIPLTLYAEKGINAAAMLEYNHGKARDSSNIIYVLCAMNIRSAVIQNGHITGNSPFFEDAFGHMVINYDGPLCQCGQYGCLNCYAAIPAVLEGFSKEVKRGHSTMIGGDVDHVTIQQVCAAARANDIPAVNAITDKAHMLGIALANYINIICPDKVILAGLMVKESELYYDTAVKTARARLGFTGNQDVTFQRLGSFSNSLTVGAGAMLLEKLIHGRPPVQHS